MGSALRYSNETTKSLWLYKKHQSLMAMPTAVRTSHHEMRESYLATCTPLFNLPNNFIIFLNIPRTVSFSLKLTFSVQTKTCKYLLIFPGHRKGGNVFYYSLNRHIKLSFHCQIYYFL